MSERQCTVRAGERVCWEREVACSKRAGERMCSEGNWVLVSDPYGGASPTPPNYGTNDYFVRPMSELKQIENGRAVAETKVKGRRGGQRKHSNK